MAAVRMAVVGAGLMGRSHAQAIRARSDCHLVAVADPAPPSQEWAREQGVVSLQTLDEVLQRGDIDAVVLATPNALHVEQTLLCLDAGLAVLLEKPVATTVADGERLLAAVQAQEAHTGQPARVLVGHHRAHSAIMAQACAVLASGQLGRVVAVQGSALFYKPDHYFDDGPWRREPGGGPILLNLIHEVHNLRMLCGEVVQVQALASNAVRGHAVEDTVAIGLRFDSGALASFVLSDTAACARSWEQTSQENPTYASYPDQDCYLIAGTQGSLAVPSMRMQRYADGAERSWWQAFESTQLPLERADPVARQMAHFVAVARGECAPLVSVRDGLANLRVTEAVVLAARNGGTVTLA